MTIKFLFSKFAYELYSIITNGTKNLNLNSNFYIKKNYSNDYFERSVNQFKIQKKLITKNKFWLIELTSFFLLIPFCILILINYFFSTKRKIKSNKLLVISSKPYKNLKRYLKKKYGKFKVFNLKLSYCSMSLEDLLKILILWKKNRSFYFIIKILYKSSIYINLIKIYKPKYVLTSSEFSFTSSWLTKLCEEKKIIHINAMHGEKIINFRDCYSTFHEMIIWNKHYKKVFSNMNLKTKKFKIIEMDSVKKIKKKKIYFITYYLKNDFKYFKKLAELIKLKNKNNKKICFRINPKTFIKKNFIEYCKKNGFYYEDPSKISLIKSFNSTSYVVSKFSSALYIAQKSGFKIAIDDLFSLKEIDNLKQRKFIVLSKKYYLLKKILN